MLAKRIFDVTHHTLQLIKTFAVIKRGQRGSVWIDRREEERRFDVTPLTLQLIKTFPVLNRLQRGSV
jgi:hypothetical protein